MAKTATIGQQSQFNLSKRPKSSVASKSNKAVSRSRAEAELIAKREFKKYIVSVSSFLSNI